MRRLRLSDGSALALLCAIALLIRLAIALLLRQGADWDIESYRLVGRAVARGSDVYAVQALDQRYPYLPFQLYLSWAAYRLAPFAGLDLTVTAKLFPILGDVLLTAAVFFAVPDRSRRVWTAALLVALNPLAILVSAVHGQFDLLAAAPAVLAWRLLRSPDAEDRAVPAGLLLGLGILLKTYPVLLLPYLLALAPSWRSRAGMLAATALPSAIALAVYDGAFAAPLLEPVMRAASYGGIAGLFGYSALSQVAFGLTPSNPLAGRAVLALGYTAVFALWLRGGRPHPQAGLLAVLSFYAFGYGFGVQYVVWLLPLAAAGRGWRWPLAYTAAALAFASYLEFGVYVHDPAVRFLGWPGALHLARLLGLAPWGVILAWLLWELRPLLLPSPAGDRPPLAFEGGAVAPLPVS